MADSRLSVRDRELFLAEPHIAALSVSAGPRWHNPISFAKSRSTANWIANACAGLLVIAPP